MGTPDVNFVNLGIEIEHMSRWLSIFGFNIAYYGMIIGCGMILGAMISFFLGHKDGEDLDAYSDFALLAIVLSVIGARIYYVIFEWDYYSQHLGEIFNIRAGGLAIYGGVITAVVSAVIYCRLKKMKFFRMADNGACGLILGQAIGRWGNFMNCEAFGGYTNNLFAMQIKRSLVREETITQELMDNLVTVNGTEYVQVHPTFLYESLWNFAVLALMLLYKKHKKADGEVLSLYFIGYGIGRFWIEGLRTDQLQIGNTGIAISQVVSVVLVVLGVALLVWRRFFVSKTEPFVLSEALAAAKVREEARRAEEARSAEAKARKKAGIAEDGERSDNPEEAGESGDKSVDGHKKKSWRS